MYLLGGICIVISKSPSYFDKASLTGYYSIKETPIFSVNAVSVLLLKLVLGFFFVTLTLTRTFYMIFLISLWMNYSGYIWISSSHLEWIKSHHCLLYQWFYRGACACCFDWMHLWISCHYYAFWIINLNSLITHLPATLNCLIFTWCCVIRKLQNLYNRCCIFNVS